MANVKITQLPELAESPASGDLFEVVDVSTGLNKKVQAQYIGGGTTPDLEAVLGIGDRAVKLLDSFSPYEFVLEDKGKFLFASDDQDRTLNAGIFADGTVLKIYNFGSIDNNIVRGIGVSIVDGVDNSDKIVSVGEVAILTNIGSDQWTFNKIGYSTSGGGATNLGYTASPTDGTVTSDTGTDATIPLADGTNAGLLKPAKYTVLENTSGTNTGDQTITLTGDVTGSGMGSFATAIANGVIVNADVNASANIDASKLGTGAVSNTEFNYLDGVTSAIQTQLDARTRFLIQRTVGSHTGNTNETLISSLEIPANTFITGSTFDWIALLNKTVTTTPTYKIYINTSNSLSGATQLGIYSSASANINMPFGRWFYLTSTDLVGSTSFGNSMLTTLGAVSNQAPVTFTYDKTQSYWFLLSTTNSDSSMTSSCINQTININ